LISRLEDLFFVTVLLDAVQVICENLLSLSPGSYEAHVRNEDIAVAALYMFKARRC
jgi:hypothetical protein